MNKALELAKLVIEYTENTNAAGEYDGKHIDWFTPYSYLAEDALRVLAYQVKQEQEMIDWNI